MSEVTLEATRGTSQITVARSLATPRLDGNEAELVIDNTKSKLEINLAMDALWRDLQNLFISAGRTLAGSAFDDGATFADGAVFSDQNTAGIT